MKITAIKQQVKRPDRYSVFVDGKYAFGLSESGLLTSCLASGQEITGEQLQAFKKTAGLDKAYGNAVRYVAMRPRSEWEMSEYLRRKGIDAEAAAQIVERLKNLQLLDDLAFAKAWIQSRRALKSASTRRLQQELRQKHVPDDVIGIALQAAATDEREALRNILEKKRARYPDDQKLMHYLARQGFSLEDIRAAMSEIQQQK
ncbi:MAG TPA: RecX family transcriptional regulator [Candidatus Saccharimonadales bacterium]|nr:RecX family transcriptional regulator [Candidatus Saccharimonadales bacterium]